MTTTCTARTKSSRRRPDLTRPDFRLSDLSETGRLQFFFHSPRSTYPIRDVTNDQRQGHKTEPHIENNTENYISECYQSNNIVPFLCSNEKFLFLFTTCKNQDLGAKYYDRRFIVGYIIKERALQRPDEHGIHWAVQGETKLVSFHDSFPLERLVGSVAPHIRMRTLTEHETQTILDHFRGSRNIIAACKREIKRLEVQV